MVCPVSDVVMCQRFSVYVCVVELSGGGALFRGFLVQARTQADQSPEGSFSVSGSEQRLSNCVTPEVRAMLAG